MSPLPLDELRIAKLADAVDAVEAEQPRGEYWKLRRAKAFAALAAAVDLAGANARAALASASTAPAGEARSTREQGD